MKNSSSQNHENTQFEKLREIAGLPRENRSDGIKKILNKNPLLDLVKIIINKEIAHANFNRKLKLEKVSDNIIQFFLKMRANEETD